MTISPPPDPTARPTDIAFTMRLGPEQCFAAPAALVALSATMTTTEAPRYDGWVRQRALDLLDELHRRAMARATTPSRSEHEAR